MIDINELRRLAQHHDDMISMAPIRPATLFKLLDRLEAAEKDYSVLKSHYTALEEELAFTRKRLRDKIDALERELLRALVRG